MKSFMATAYGPTARGVRRPLVSMEYLDVATAKGSADRFFESDLRGVVRVEVEDKDGNVVYSRFVTGLEGGK